MFRSNNRSRYLYLTVICLALVFVLSLLYAPNASSLVVMTQVGDYVIQPNTASIGGSTDWQVMDLERLNCRAAVALRPLQLFSARDNGIGEKPSVSEWEVLTTFEQGDQFQAVLGGRSGSPIVVMDDRGKPWIGTSIGEEQGDCLVRANSQFIRQVLPDSSKDWRCQCRATDCGSREHPNSRFVARRVDPSSPEYMCFPMMPRS